ncbi:MAG: hypothetical protein CM15mP74_20090 [Halieaceae bacterium]|nr:MAG: hypothetical protein CM15mP74_20090 [Halieaceae bacterium]
MRRVGAPADGRWILHVGLPSAWHEVGGFDERFGRGYGEEVEFCMATAANGWRHLLACDVFVYHAGGTSFGYESEQLKVEAQQIIDDRYPQFPDLVQDWIREDPALDARVRCDVQLLGLTDAPRILHVTHNMGGGVEHTSEIWQRPARQKTIRSIWCSDPGARTAIDWSASGVKASSAS